jgi:hypothetical protein
MRTVASTSCSPLSVSSEPGVTTIVIRSASAPRESMIGSLVTQQTLCPSVALAVSSAIC